MRKIKRRAIFSTVLPTVKDFYYYFWAFKNLEIRMFKKSPIIFWILMFALTLSFMELVSSIYYFQRTHDSPFAVVQIWHDVKRKIDQTGILAQSKRISRYENDDRLGWSLRKNTTTVEVCGDKKITYTTDSNNERFIPGPKISAGSIVFLGGSFTFGSCVNDQENYPYILATEHWKNWDIRNAAVGAWGTSQAYLMLSDLVESNPPPSMIIYGMISHHIQRNYLSNWWISQLAKSARKLPHFELVNGDLVFQGVVGPSAGKEMDREIQNKEIELTSAFLRSMQKKSAERDIPFIVVLLPTTGRETYPPAVMDTMYQSNIPVLDLTRLPFKGVNSDRYKHPNPMDAHRIANAIAKSFISDVLDNIELSVQ